MVRACQSRVILMPIWRVGFSFHVSLYMGWSFVLISLRSVFEWEKTSPSSTCIGM